MPKLPWIQCGHGVGRNTAYLVRVSASHPARLTGRVASGGGALVAVGRENCVYSL